MDAAAISGRAGRDVSGEVLELGAGVRRLKKGDKVLGVVQRAFVEQVVARECAFALVPPVLDLRDAAAILATKSIRAWTM